MPWFTDGLYDALEKGSEMSQTAAELLAPARRQDLPPDSFQSSLQFGPDEERAVISPLCRYGLSAGRCLAAFCGFKSDYVD